MWKRYCSRNDKYGEAWITAPTEILEKGLLYQFRKKKWVDVAVYAFLLFQRTKGKNDL